MHGIHSELAILVKRLGTVKLLQIIISHRVNVILHSVAIPLPYMQALSYTDLVCIEYTNEQSQVQLTVDRLHVNPLLAI